MSDDVLISRDAAIAVMMEMAGAYRGEHVNANSLVACAVARIRSLPPAAGENAAHGPTHELLVRHDRRIAALEYGFDTKVEENTAAIQRLQETVRDLVLVTSHYGEAGAEANGRLYALARRLAEEGK